MRIRIAASAREHNGIKTTFFLLRWRAPRQALPVVASGADAGAEVARAADGRDEEAGAVAAGGRLTQELVAPRGRRVSGHSRRRWREGASARVRHHAVSVASCVALCARRRRAHRRRVGRGEGERGERALQPRHDGARDEVRIVAVEENAECVAPLGAPPGAGREVEDEAGAQRFVADCQRQLPEEPPERLVIGASGIPAPDRGANTEALVGGDLRVDVELAVGEPTRAWGYGRVKLH